MYVGTATFKDGKPICPECSEPMEWTGLKRPTRRTPLFRCKRCRTEFPPAEARAILEQPWYARPAVWLLAAAVVAVVLVGLLFGR